MTSGRRSRTRALLAALIVSALTAPAALADFTLTILHNNDGESQLNPTDIGGNFYGGLAPFVNKLNTLRGSATTDGVLTLNSGDNFLASQEFQASIDNGTPYFDSIGLWAGGFDALTLGNHEFDFGTGVLANFINSFDGAPATGPGGETPVSPKAPAFLSANLDFSGDANLAPLAGSKILPSTIVETGGMQIGIIGATTPNLPSISSPGGVTVIGGSEGDIGSAAALTNLANIINAEAQALTDAGVNKIVLMSHLQGLQTEIDLAGLLTNVDVIIGGGGDELLSGAGGQSALVPGDTADPILVYGELVNGIPVVTTPGEYRYVGKLVLNFDDDGNLLGVIDGESGLQRVADVDGDSADPYVQATVIDPVNAALADVTVIATSEVPLDSRRNSPEGIGERVSETNLGDIFADAFVFTAEQSGMTFTGAAIIGLANGGGIRQPDDLFPAGDVTDRFILNQAPFANLVGYIDGLTVSELLAVVEHGVANVENVDGRFPQISGFKFSYFADAAPGSRVDQIMLADGTLLYDAASGFMSDLLLTLVTTDFTGGGGDGFPLSGLDGLFAGTNVVGAADEVTYADFIAAFIMSPDGLNGLISAADYPVEGTGRIVALTAIPTPAAFSAGLGLMGVLTLRRRRRAA